MGQRYFGGPRWKTGRWRRTDGPKPYGL